MVGTLQSPQQRSQAFERPTPPWTPVGGWRFVGQGLQWPLGPLSGATSSSLHLQEARTGRGVATGVMSRWEAVGRPHVFPGTALQELTLLFQVALRKQRQHLHLLHWEMETARLWSCELWHQKDFSFSTCTYDLQNTFGDPARAQAGLLHNNGFDWPVPERCGSNWHEAKIGGGRLPAVGPGSLKTSPKLTWSVRRGHLLHTEGFGPEHYG